MTPQPRALSQRGIAERVLRAKDGDRSAIEALAQRASTNAYRTALVALGEPHAAADVSQETAVRALRGFDRLRDPAKFDAWVYRISVSEVRRALAKDRRHDHDPLSDHAQGLIGEGMDGAVEDRVWRRAGIREAVESLSDRQRIALALRYVHDLGDAAIADALKCRQGTVRSLLSRGLRALADHPALADHRGPEPDEERVSLKSKEATNEC